VTTHGDICSFGSVMLQTLSGKLPYHYLRRDAEVLLELTRGLQPSRPSEVADEHWSLISRCWADEPVARPGISDVSQWVRKQYLTFSSSVLEGNGCAQTAHGPSDLVPTNPLAIKDSASIVNCGSPSPLTLVCAALTTFLSYQVIP